MIRPAQPRDLPAVLRLVRDLAAYEREPDAVAMTEADLASALFGPTPAARCLVASADEHLVGFAIWHPTFSTWTGRPGMFLVDLFVRPEHRRDGHGRALLTELATTCRRNGYARLEWNVLDWNAPAQAFYRTLGARPLDGWSTWRLDEAAIAALTAQPAQREPI